MYVKFNFQILVKPGNLITFSRFGEYVSVAHIYFIGQVRGRTFNILHFKVDIWKELKTLLDLVDSPSPAEVGPTMIWRILGPQYSSLW